MKKTIILLLFSFLLPYYHYAQVRIETSVLNTNLFEHFINGSVRLKNGSVEQAPLNYDTQNQSIVFKKEDQILVLTNIESVDTVYMQDKKFVPVANGFYEVVMPTTQIGLYITYGNNKKPLVATTEHTGTTRRANTDVSNTVSGVYVSRPFNANYTLEITKHYWLRRGNSFYKANNEKQLIKVFPFKHNELIKNYIKENNIDFSKQADVVKLVAYCNAQMK
jgi:hypothetical protein